MELLNTAAVLIGLLLFEAAAWRWGVNSTDGLDSPEWERRRAWWGPRDRAR